MRRVFDSNILVYHLNDALPSQVAALFAQSLKENAVISVITHIELLGWSGHTDQSIEQAKKLLTQFDEYPLSGAIVEHCIILRRKHPIKLPDAIIAATALQLELPLVTRNVDDFKNIEFLELINPFDFPVSQ